MWRKYVEVGGWNLVFSQEGKGLVVNALIFGIVAEHEI